MHIAVLQKEVIEYLDPKPNENFIDATVGGASHTLTILESNAPKGKVLGIDRDPEILKNIRTCPRQNLDFQLKYKNRLILVCDNFANLKEIIKKKKFSKIAGILFDLGMSSWHLEQSGRGFSFQRREPLDMRYNPQNQLTAEKIVNYWSKFEIERILREYGEEKFAAEIAQELVNVRGLRPIKNTFQLVEIIKRGIPRRRAFGSLRGRHFATRTFQALRIAVNDELNSLKEALPQALDLLKPGGRLAVISFHSLEDRIVKNFFRDLAQGGEARPFDGRQAKEELLKILTKKPISPSNEEIRRNPRARSAKLRAAKKL